MIPQQRAEDKYPALKLDDPLNLFACSAKRLAYIEGWNDHAKEVEGLVGAFEKIEEKLQSGIYDQVEVAELLLIARTALDNYKKKT